METCTPKSPMLKQVQQKAAQTRQINFKADSRNVRHAEKKSILQEL